MSEIKVQRANEQPEITMDEFGVDEARSLKSLMVHFIKEYQKKPANQNDEEWLTQRYLAEFPDINEEEAAQLSKETVESVLQYDKNLTSIKESRKKGQTAEEWFAEKTHEAAAGMATNAVGQRMMALDNTLEAANAQMQRAITTKSGDISQCLNLDGFIAEQHHVNSFNAAAAASDLPFYAEVCVPEAGQTYGKNSFDVVIRNRNDPNPKTNRVHQYQFKYGKDAKATIRMLKEGNYDNQRFLVPPEQVEEVQAAFPGKTVTSVIGGTDQVPVSSSPFSKTEAKELQTEVQQSELYPEMNWGSYDSRMLAKYVGKQAFMAGVQGAAISVGFHLAAKIVADEPIEPEEVVTVALETGSDVGIKTATAGAIKVAADRGIIKVIPAGTPIQVIVNIACVAIENVKILSRVANGELTLLEGLDLMGCNTVAMVYGLSWGATGSVVGVLALGWIPIVGPVVGGLAGGLIGYMAGSKFGEKVYEAAKAAVNVAKTAVKKMWETTKAIGRKIKEGIKRLLPW